VGGKPDVARMREYLEFVQREAGKRFDDGLDVDAAVDSIDLGPWAGLNESSRIAQNVVNVYGHRDPSREPVGRLDVLGRIAALEGFTG
jgi:hypothetical protein